MDRFSATVDGGGVLTLDTGKITLGPLPVARRPAGDHPAEDPDRLHLMTDEPDRRAPVPGDDPRRAGCAARGAPARDASAAEPAPAERFTAPPRPRATAG